jgi:hypothetical protein
MCQERRPPSVFKSVKKLVTTLAIGSLLVLPATALAGNGGHHSVPPGNSGLDQYTENIPGAGGNHPTGGGGSHHPGGGGGGSGSSVTPGVTHTLDSQGPAGQGAASLAAATAPDVGGNAPAGHGGKSGGSANAKGGSGTTASGAASGGNAPSGGNAASGGSGSGVDAIAAELTGSGVDNGMGIFLPIILGAALIGALGLVVLRLRRGPQQTGS